MTRWLLIAWGVCWIGWGLTAPAFAEEDSGYFLSMKQKGQLIWSGEIEDSQKNLYIIHYVPGYYVQPESISREFFDLAGKEFSAYWDSKHYDNLTEASSGCLNWANDCLFGFALKESLGAWVQQFGHAKEGIRNRVFGWWLAYPWAVVESTAETAFRVPVGMTATAGATAAGLVAVPTYYLTAPGVKTGFFSGIGTGILGASWTWNTAVAPPLALLGQKPSSTRRASPWVGFIPAKDRSSLKPDADDLKTLADFGVLFLQETADDEKARHIAVEEARQEEAQLREEIKRTQSETEQKVRNLSARIESVQKQSRSQWEQVNQKEKAHMDRILSEAEYRPLSESLREGKWSRTRIEQYKNDIQKALMEKGVSESDAKATCEWLVRYFW